MSRRDADDLKASVAALIGEEATAHSRFGVAVSGGPDSLGLLLLASDAFAGRIEAASVNHRLRPEAAAECAHVAAICASLGVPHHILYPDTPPAPNQAAARDVRYALLEPWRAAQGIDWLLTGHHADDQLETMVMRLNRSSGVGGLAGVRARNGHVLRPLLGWRRDDLAAVVAAAGITPVEDPSNRDPKHDRARLRMAMAGQEWLDPVAVTASAAALQDAEEALTWATQQLAAQRIAARNDGFVIDSSDLPSELLRRILLQFLADRSGPMPRAAEIERFIAALRSGRQATLAGWIAKAEPKRAEIWHFQPERDRQHR